MAESVENICTVKRLLKGEGLSSTVPAISSRVVSGTEVDWDVHASRE